MDNGPFLHWIVWTLATLFWCAIVYRQMRISRPLIAIAVGVMALLVGYIKELTDVEFGVMDLWMDFWGVCLGVMLFFLLVRRHRLNYKKSGLVIRWK